MEVNLNSSVTAITSRYVSRPAPPKTETESADSFAATAALEENLRATPDVRPEVVERARQLAAQKAYPAEETIIKIASLLAAELSKANPS